MKEILMSIQPKWVEKIAQGEKTIEVRKTKPKLETPFKCYIYCTNGKDLLREVPCYYRHKLKETKYRIINEDYNKNPIANGKVIGEFVCDRIDEYDYDQAFDESMGCFIDKYGYDITSQELAQTCLSYGEIERYGNTNRLYGWHISDLKIYDKPKELSEFRTVCEGLKPYQCDKCEYSYTENTENGSYAECCCNNLKPMKRPPQSWCYVEKQDD